MLDLLRTRLAQGMHTTTFPHGVPEFPERFRGRPLLDCSGCGGKPCLSPDGDAPSAHIRRNADEVPRLDAGACLFAPEEMVGVAGCGVAFSHDYRMASRTREGLVSASGEIELAAALDERARGLFGRSLRLRSVAAGSCNGCESELTALGNVVFDMARFGVQFVASPRHADGIVITGTVNRNMRDALDLTYAAVPDPRLVIAVGACALSGGPFQGSGEAGAGVPPSIPVDLWIPGCPPHPLTVLDGLLRLLGRIGEDPSRAAGGGSKPKED